MVIFWKWPFPWWLFTWKLKQSYSIRKNLKIHPSHFVIYSKNDNLDMKMKILKFPEFSLSIEQSLAWNWKFIYTIFRPRQNVKAAIHHQSQLKTIQWTLIVARPRPLPVKRKWNVLLNAQKDINYLDWDVWWTSFVNAQARWVWHIIK